MVLRSVVALEVDIDRDVCMGSGNCVYEAPGAFDLDDDGIAIVVDPAAVAEDTVRAADRRSRCPTPTRSPSVAVVTPAAWRAAR